MPKVYKHAKPDPEGSKLWRQFLKAHRAKWGRGQNPELLEPELYARHTEHRRWLSHTRETSVSAHSPSKARQNAAPPTPRDQVFVAPRREPVIIDLGKPKKMGTKNEWPETWKLPPLIKLGDKLFKTEQWMDERYHQPEKIRCRRVVRA